MNEKEQLIQNVNASVPVMEQMHQLEMEITALEDEVQKKSQYGCGTGIVLGMVVLFGIFSLGILLGGRNNNPNDTQQALICVGIMVVCLVFLFRQIKRVKTCKSQLGLSKQKLILLRADNSLSWLPESYRTSSCISAIRSYLLDGRADSLKEAINLLETEMHQQRLEDSAFLGAYYANKTN